MVVFKLNFFYVLIVQDAAISINSASQTTFDLVLVSTPRFLLGCFRLFFEVLVQVAPFHANHFLIFHFEF